MSEKIETTTEPDSGLNPDCSRREFVKGVGGVALVAALGGFRVGDFAVLPVSGGYILVDSKECAGCTSCMAACTLVHEGKVGLSTARIQNLRNEMKAFPNDISMHQCHQCENPPCVAACTMGALTADASHGNVRMIDPAKCDACLKCIQACPYDPANLQFHPDVNKVQKCDLCAHTPFWNETGGPGGKQACVAVCPARAIKFTTTMPVQDGTASGYDIDMYTEPAYKRGWKLP